MSSNAGGSPPHPLRWARVGTSRTPRSAGIDSFTVALRIGATGIVLAPWRSDDGELTIGRKPGRMSRGSLTVPLEDIWGHVQHADQVAVDFSNLTEPGVADLHGAVEQAHLRGYDGSIWLLGTDAEMLARAKRDAGGPGEAISTLHLTDPRSTTRGAEAHAAWLREVGIDGVMAPEEHTSGGLIALMHRFGRLVFADGADFRRTARRALEVGVDGVCGGDAEALHDAFSDLGGAPSEP